MYVATTYLWEMGDSTTFHIHCMQVMCVAAPVRQQREVFSDVKLVTKSPTGE